MSKNHPTRFLIPAAFVFLVMVAGAIAQETPAAPPGPAPAVEKSLLDLFYAGGALMWPILACSIGTIAVGVYCFI